MKAYVNSNCISCGLCMTLCPDVFFPNGDGTAKAMGAQIPDDGKVMVIEAKTNCPVIAIETTGE